MAGFVRKIHPQTSFVYDTIEKAVPDMAMAGEDATGKKIEMFALSTVDPDQEKHVFLMDEAGRKNLIAILTGGVLVAQPGEILQ